MISAKLLKLSTIGALLGITIGITIELIFSAYFQSEIYTPGAPEFLDNFSNIHLAVLIERIIYALIGALSFISSLLFNIEKLSLAQATGINLILMLTLTLLSGWYLKWYPLNLSIILSFILVFIAVYFFIWISFWFYYKHQINKIN